MVILFNYVFFRWGLHTLWESPRMAEQVSGTFFEWDYNDCKSVLLMSRFYLLETNSTWMRMCRLRMCFCLCHDFSFSSQNDYNLWAYNRWRRFFWGSISYKALRSTPVGDQMVKRGIILDYLMNTEILHTYIVQISAKDWNTNANVIFIMKHSPQQGECSVCELHRFCVRIPRRSNFSGEFAYPDPK